MNQQISRWDNEYSQHYRNRQATDDRHGQRRVGFAAGAELQGHRQQADQRGARRHQHRAQAHPAGQRNGFAHRAAFLHQSVCEFHNENAIGDDDSHHHHHPHQ